MALETIKFNWKNEFSGTMQAPRSEIKVGENDGEMSPYNLLIGALGGCYYHTFLEIASKKRLTFKDASVEISGSKRETEPMMLEYALIKLTVVDPSNEGQFLKTAKLAEEHCSIHRTLSKVATIELEVNFK
jgi:putative redox protein